MKSAHSCLCTCPRCAHSVCPSGNVTHFDPGGCQGCRKFEVRQLVRCVRCSVLGPGIGLSGTMRRSMCSTCAVDPRAPARMPGDPIPDLGLPMHQPVIPWPPLPQLPLPEPLGATAPTEPKSRPRQTSA